MNFYFTYIFKKHIKTHVFLFILFNFRLFSQFFYFLIIFILFYSKKKKVTDSFSPRVLHVTHMRQSRERKSVILRNRKDTSVIISQVGGDNYNLPFHLFSTLFFFGFKILNYI